MSCRLTSALVLGILCVGLVQAQAEPEASWERLLVAGYKHDKIQIIRRDGSVEWFMTSKDKTCDAWMLPDRTIIYACSDNGTKIVKPDYEAGEGGEVIWHRPINANGQSHSCQPLDNGYFLIGESYDGVSYAVEVNREHHVRKRTEIKGIGGRHSTFRCIRKTPEGTYLIGGEGEGYKGRRAMEIDGDGKVLRRFPGGGWLGVRLPGGNTLFSSGSPHWGDCTAKLFETDPAGEIVWKLEEKDMPAGVQLGFVCGVQRLPNGNTLVCNGKYNMGRNANPGPAIFEITPDKKIVWSWGRDIVNHVTSVMVLDHVDTPCSTTVAPKLHVPESIACMPESKTFFVSNIDTETEGYWEKDGKGHISLLGYDGAVIEERWLDSKPDAVLHAPKGLAILDGYLYIADIDRLLRVPIEGKRKLEVLPVHGLQRANDVAAHKGEIYVSDSKAGKVHAYNPASRDVRQVHAPAGVNGLTFRGDAMFAVSWPLHEIYELDPSGAAAPQAFGLAEHFETLDGIGVLPDGRLIVSDCFGGAIRIIGRDRKTVSLYQKLKGPADLDVDAVNGVLLIPQVLGNRAVLFHQRGGRTFEPENILDCR